MPTPSCGTSTLIHAWALFDDPESELVLPLIALAEICWIVEKGRTNIPSVRDVLRDLDSDPRLTVLPLDRGILEISLGLQSIAEMHDRQIAATTLYLKARGLEVVLLTKDANITASMVVDIKW